MTRHILVINGNPDPGGERLSAALANAYAEGAEAAGHTVHRINVGGLDFPLLRSAGEFAAEPQEPDIVAARGAMLLAEHVVFIYPLWLGGPPALLKAFMEQLARDDFAIAPGKRFPVARLKGRTARMVVTMGMPAFAYRLGFGAHGVKAFARSILGIAGIRPVTTDYFGGLRPAVRYPRLVERMRRLGRQGI